MDQSDQSSSPSQSDAQDFPQEGLSCLNKMQVCCGRKFALSFYSIKL